MPSQSAASASSPSDELATLRAELAKEQAELAHMEESVEMRAAQLSYLNAEYLANISRVQHYYDPKLQPLLEMTHAAGVKQRFIEEQIAWLERKTVEQDRCATENGMFIEARDMRPAAEEAMKAARQRLLRAYEEITSCPAEALRVLVNYENPPDAAVETMFMVLRLRGEAERNGPIVNGVKPEAPVSITPAAPSRATNADAAPATGRVGEQTRLLSAAVACWPHATILVSHNYFTNFFAARSEAMLNGRELLEPALMAELEQFCESAAHTVEELHKCSVPIGCLGEWLFAVRDIYRVRMVTAPVLLRAAENITADGLQRVRDTLEYITFGRGTLPPPLNGNNTIAAAARTVEADATRGVTAPSEMQVAQLGETPTEVSAPTSGSVAQVYADLLAKYQQSKQCLAAMTRPSAVSREMIVKLRHRLRQLDEECVDARESEAKLLAEMEEKKAEVRANYDDTMLTLHDQLESQTTAFVARLTGEATETTQA